MSWLPECTQVSRKSLTWRVSGNTVNCIVQLLESFIYMYEYVHILQENYTYHCDGDHLYDTKMRNQCECGS